MKILMLGSALFGVVLSLAGPTNASEQKIIAFNISPEVHSSIQRISQDHGVTISKAYGADNLGLLLYVLNSPGELAFLPKIFDFHGRSDFLKSPYSWSNTKITRPDGSTFEFVLMVAIRSLAPEHWADDTFDCGVVRGAAASLITRADDTKLSVSDVAKLSAELSC